MIAWLNYFTFMFKRRFPSCHTFSRIYFPYNRHYVRTGNHPLIYLRESQDIRTIIIVSATSLIFIAGKSMSSHQTKGTSSRSTEEPSSPGSFNIRVNPLHIVSLITMCGKNFDFRQPQILSITVCCFKTNPFHLFLRKRDTFRTSIIGNSCYTKLRSITKLKSSTGKMFSKRHTVI